MAAGQTTAGDEVPPGTEVIEVHLSELGQIFNSMDPSPFHEKDLDGDAEEFIVGWAKELPPRTSRRRVALTASMSPWGNNIFIIGRAFCMATLGRRCDSTRMLGSLSRNGIRIRCN